MAPAPKQNKIFNYFCIAQSERFFQMKRVLIQDIATKSFYIDIKIKISFVPPYVTI